MKRLVSVLLVAIFAMTLLAACGSSQSGAGTETAVPESTAAAVSYPLTVTDDTGRSVTIKAQPKAVVSLAPSNTEIMYALAKDSELVGVSDLDDYPPEVSTKKVVGGGFEPNLEEIVNLNPDLVLAIGGNTELVGQLESRNLTVLVLDPKDVNGVYADIELIGQVVGASDRAQELASTMKERVQSIQDKVKGSGTPKVFFEVDATDPTKPFTAGPGTFINELITMAGGENIAGDTGTQWPQLSAEEIVSEDPDIIILADQNVPSGGQNAETVSARPAWGGIKAVKDKAIYPIDTNLVSRPGPRLVDGLEAIAEIIHPEVMK